MIQSSSNVVPTGTTPTSSSAQLSATDTEALRLYYEKTLRTNPNNIQGVYYLAMWHLERQSYQQAKRFFAHLATLKSEDVDIWLSLAICCAFSEDYEDSYNALISSKKYIKNSEAEIRWKFCQGK